jgi:kynureninase
MFDEVGMDASLKKEIKLPPEFVLQEIDKEVDSSFEIITLLIRPKEVVNCQFFTWRRA